MSIWISKPSDQREEIPQIKNRRKGNKMILAEKIAYLRKQKDWSQEELADQLEISRQSVSKWESAASIPELDKIIRMSAIFGVSTDFLLKDEYDIDVIQGEKQGEGSGMEELQGVDSQEGLSGNKVRTLSLEEANTYLETVQKTCTPTAWGVMLCILSPICLLLLGGWAEMGVLSITENLAAGLGIVILLLMVAGAVALFITNGMKLQPYEYLERESIRLQYGVSGILEKQRNDVKQKYQKNLVIGVTLCILSVVPLMAAMGFDNGEEDIRMVYSLCLLLAVASIGVFLLVREGCIWDSYAKLLQEGDYSEEKKRNRRKVGPLVGAYWCLVTAVYLAVNFYHTSLGDNSYWKTSWPIWPVAALIFVVLLGIFRAVAQFRDRS